MNIKDFILGYLIGKQDGGSGASVEPLSVTENGEYSEEGVAYSPVTVNVSGGGGLEYETGTWTPSEDVQHGSISFTNQHTKAPAFYALVDTSDRSALTQDTVYTCIYVDYYKIFGMAFPWGTTGTSVRTVGILENYITSSTSNSQTAYCAKYSDDTGDSTENYPRFWAKETGIYPYVYNPSRSFRANHTFKWIAIWMPES